MQADILITNIGQLVTCRPKGQGPLTGPDLGHLEVIQDGAVAALDGTIVAVGTRPDLDEQIEPSDDFQIIDADGKVVTPGLVDPHTHPVFATTREDEFEMRNQGKSYMEIAEAGGGIRTSVRKLREASNAVLLRLKPSQDTACRLTRRSSNSK